MAQKFNSEKSHSYNSSDSESLSTPLLNQRTSKKGPPLIDDGYRPWIYYSLAASIIFTSCNLFMVELAKQGLSGYLYLSFGTVTASALYFSHKLAAHKAKLRRWMPRWSDLHYIVDYYTGELKWDTIKGLVLYSLFYQGGNLSTMKAF